MAINHLLNGMILQVTINHPTQKNMTHKNRRKNPAEKRCSGAKASISSKRLSKRAKKDWAGPPAIR